MMKVKHSSANSNLLLTSLCPTVPLSSCIKQEHNATDVKSIVIAAKNHWGVWCAESPSKTVHNRFSRLDARLKVMAWKLN